VNKFRDTKIRYAQPDRYNPLKLLKEMADWALEHVSVTDRELATFLLEKEVKLSSLSFAGTLPVSPAGN